MYLHISSKGVKGWLEQRPVVTTQGLQDRWEGVSTVERQIRINGLSLLGIGHTKIDLYQLLRDHLLEREGRRGDRRIRIFQNTSDHKCAHTHTQRKIQF